MTNYEFNWADFIWSSALISYNIKVLIKLGEGTLKLMIKDAPYVGSSKERVLVKHTYLCSNTTVIFSRACSLGFSLPIRG